VPVLAGAAEATGLVLAAGLRAAGALTRDGLVTAGAAFVGPRQPAARRAMTGRIGIAMKDLLLLLRNRNFLVQTLVLPLAMADFQGVTDPGAALAAAAVRQEALSLEFVVAAVLAVVGVFLHAFLGAGIGTLATDPLEADPWRRIHPDRMLLFMLLAGFYAFAIYTPSLLAKLAQLVLNTGLAFAVWQKVRDHFPTCSTPSRPRRHGSAWRTGWSRPSPSSCSGASLP